MVGRPDGEAGNRTSYSPIGAETGAELGKKVEAGLEFFRQSLPYSICVKRIIFFMDKDFD